MKNLNLPKQRTFVGPALVWKRIAAFFIDILIINLIVFFPFRRMLQNIFPEGYSFSETYQFLGANYTGFIVLASLIMSILAILYFIMLEKKMSQTIGKMLLKIYVVSDNPEMKSWQLLTRNIVFIPIFPFILLWALDPLFMFFTKTNQRLSEILSKTKVVGEYNMN